MGKTRQLIHILICAQLCAYYDQNVASIGVAGENRKECHERQEKYRNAETQQDIRY